MSSSAMLRRLPIIASATVLFFIAAAAGAQTFDSSAFAGMRWREIGPYRGGRSVAVAGSSKRPLEYWMGTTGGGVFKTVDGGMNWTPTDRSLLRRHHRRAGPERVEPRHRLGRRRRERHSRQHGAGRRRLDDEGRRPHVEPHRVLRREEPRQPHSHPSDQSRHRLGRRARPRLRAELAARRVQDDRRRQDVAPRALSRRPDRHLRSHSRPDEPRRDLRGVLARVSHAVVARVGRTRRRHLQVHRRRRDVEGTDRERRDCPRGCGARSGSRCRPPSRRACGRSSRPTRAACIAPTTAARRGPGSTTSASSASARGTTRASTPIRSDTNVVYALNTGVYRSRDGGKTFPQSLNPPHGDNHDLWIAPNDPDRMIERQRRRRERVHRRTAAPGRRRTSRRRSSITSRRRTTSRTTSAARSRTTARCAGRAGAPAGSRMADWEDAGGGESGYIAASPLNPDVVFAGSYGGLLTRKDMRTELERDVNPWPDNPMGMSSEDIKYKFQWTFPIMFSPHDPNTMYVGGSQLFVTQNEGQSYRIISPPLARNDPKTLGASGGPITKDQTGVETYGVIFALAESPLVKGVIWAGSDDGLIHLTRDGGVTWKNVTPNDIGDFTRISIIEAGHFGAGTAYVAANRYQQDDFSPDPLQDHRLRRHVDEDRERAAVGRVHAGDSRGPGAQGAALRGHRARRVGVVQRRRAVAAHAAQPPAGAGARSGDQGRRPDRGDARAVVLHPRRPLAASADERGDAREGCPSVQAARHVPDRLGRRARRWRWRRRQRRDAAERRGGVLHAQAGRAGGDARVRRYVGQGHQDILVERGQRERVAGAGRGGRGAGAATRHRRRAADAGAATRRRG